MINYSIVMRSVNANLLEINRRQKRFDLFDADLKSASSENAQRRHEKPTAADCKSALKWSNLFCLRISNHKWLKDYFRHVAL